MPEANHDIPAPPNSVYIRNVRYVPYLEIAQALMVSFAIALFMGCSALMRHDSAWGPWVMGTLGLVVWGVPISFVLPPRSSHFAVGRWLELGNQSLRLRYRSHLPATELRRFVYLPDPQQDYADDLAKRVVLVQIEPQEGRAIRLFCSTADVEHLSTWANANGVPLDDQREKRDA